MTETELLDYDICCWMFIKTGAGNLPSPDDVSPQEVQSSSENPWMLQDWCVEHPEDCTKYDVYNQTKSWLQVDLKNTETGESGFYTIQSKTAGQITLIPGQYQTTFSWSCDGKSKSVTEVMSVGQWMDYVKGPLGY